MHRPLDPATIRAPFARHSDGIEVPAAKRFVHFGDPPPASRLLIAAASSRPELLVKVGAIAAALA